MSVDWGWKHLPLSRQEEMLWLAGCTCDQPLLGWRPNKGPRCRMCNVVAVGTVEEVWGPEEVEQKRLI